MLELRHDDTGESPGIVSGVALVYGQPSRPLDRKGTRERIEPGTFGELGEVFARFGHQRDRLLARFPGGGLDLTDSPIDLRFTLTLPDTTDGRDAAALVRRGVLRGVSIEFIRRQTRAEGSLLIVSRGTLRGLAPGRPSRLSTFRSPGNPPAYRSWLTSQPETATPET